MPGGKVQSSFHASTLTLATSVLNCDAAELQRKLKYIYTQTYF